MALTSVRSNKMRSLLTMLGIIIGIAAVIAIETVGNSMTGSVMDSMSGMGASNISVTVTQKSSSDTSGTSQGVRLRRFMDSKPSDADLITDAMMDDFTAAFPTQVDHIELTQQVGSGTTAKYGDPTTTITVGGSELTGVLRHRVQDGSAAYAAIRADDLVAGEAGPNALAAQIETIEYRGREFVGTARTRDGIDLVFRSDHPVELGSDVHLRASSDRVLVFGGEA